MKKIKIDRPDMKGISPFTLLELLIVIAIIAILATLLLPMLNKAKERGKAAVCAGNMHQIGVVINTYANDYNYYPWPSWNRSTGENWFKAMDGYVPIKYSYNFYSWILRCPVTSELCSTSSSNFLSNPYMMAATAPWTNLYGISGSDAGTAVKPGAVPAPSLKVMVTERDKRANFSLDIRDSRYLYNTGMITDSTDYAGTLFPIHLNSSNFLFIDGHTASLKSDEFNAYGDLTRATDIWARLFAVFDKR